MTKKLFLSNTITGILGLIIAATNSAYSQNLQSAIIAQPQDQLVQQGGTVTLSCGAVGVVDCQWMCNGVELEGETNCELTLPSVQIADAGYYSCLIATSSGIESTEAASLTVLALTPQSQQNLVVFGTPIVGSGNEGKCPGPYKGYVCYMKTAAQGWGWAPSTNTTVFVASDPNRTNTKVEYVGDYGDGGCAKSSVTIPYPCGSPVYRFTIYFTNNVPTTNYSISLTGFNP